MTANEDAARLHQLVGLAYLPAVKAINAAMDELELTYTAKKPIQGEGSNKVLAYRVALATVETLLAARTSIGPDSERIRELEAEVAKLRRERDRARAMVPLPPPDPRMSVRACCGDTHPHGGPECSHG